MIVFVCRNMQEPTSIANRIKTFVGGILSGTLGMGALQFAEPIAIFHQPGRSQQ